MSAVGGLLIAIGVLLVLLAGVGLLRFPDVLTRANAATKAAGLGVACVLGGVAFVMGTREAAIKMTIGVILQFTTAPVAGHVIGRAAYRSGAPLWDGTEIDDLRGFRERPHERAPVLAPDPAAESSEPSPHREDGTPRATDEPG